MMRTLVPRRRELFLVPLWLAFIVSTTSAAAGTLDALTSTDAAGGLRAALSQGIDTAVAQLGANNGFLNDPKVSIPLPPALQKADRALRRVGMGIVRARSSPSWPRDSGHPRWHRAGRSS